MHNNINLIRAFAMATILNKCLEFTINPNELRDLETGNPIDLNKLIDQAEYQLTNKATHYLALYINRDEPTLAIEPAASRKELCELYDSDDIDSISSIDTYKLNGITYTIETVEDI